MENMPSEAAVVKNTAETSGKGLVNKYPLYETGDQVLPLVITSGQENVKLEEWIYTNEAEFREELTKHGGILLRGFGIDTPLKFSSFMNCFDTEPLPYMFRSSPRHELDSSLKNLYLSTSYPSDRSINMHNESSYSRVWGRKIVFCCIKPSETGGETPIADSRRVLKDIDKKLVDKFRDKGVKYVRNLLSDLGMPWQEVFQTNDLSVARATCEKNNIECKVIDDDHIVIEWVKPAIYKHPVSGAETWFNHILFFNKFSRYEELGLGSDDDLPFEFLTSNTFFGDGSDISYNEYSDIKQAYSKNIVSFPYEKGDVLFLDNMLAAHGRNPYKGERTIATAIIEAAYDEGYRP